MLQHPIGMGARNLEDTRDEGRPIPSITRLSEDVLAHVFSEVVRMYDLRGTPSYLVNERPHGWLVLGHVCKAWRRVLCDRAVLWSRIILADRYPDRVKAFLEHSRNCPIEIEGKHAKRATLAAWSLALWRECSRWVRAEVTITEGVVHEIIGPLDLPLLEELYVTMDGVTDFPPLTRAALPRLKSLECKSCGWSSLSGWLRPTLTTLRVSGLARQSLPSVYDWLDALRGLPALRELHLMRSSIAITELTAPILEAPETLVPLPNLRTFHAAQYVSQISSATHLLMLIAPHAECCIHLEVLTFYWSVPLPTMTAMVTSLAYKLSTFPAAPDAFHIALEVNMPQGQWLDFSVGHRSPSGGATAMRKQLQVSIDLSGEDDAYTTALVSHIWASTLLDAAADVAVERLDTGDVHVAPVLDVARAADVQALRIACPVSLAVFADALESHLELPDAADPFPRLRAVAVDTAKVGPAECAWERTPLERVQDAVARRTEGGLGPVLVLV